MKYRQIFLAYGFIIAQGEACQTAKTPRGTELGHIRTNFREDGNGTAVVDAGDGAEKGDITRTSEP